MKDKEIIENILAGKTEEFEKIVHASHSHLYKIGLYFLHTKNEIEDVMQTTYLKAFENLSTFRGDATLKSWLVRIMINECKQINRRRILLKKFQSSHIEIDRRDYNTSESEIINAELKSQLDAAISKLSPKCKSVFVRRLILGVSTRDTAQELGIYEEAVKVRLLRAKRKLKHDLQKAREWEQLCVQTHKLNRFFPKQLSKKSTKNRH